MDPFEIRLSFTRMLQRLNASVNAAKNCAAFALKNRDLDDDLHSCILEQLEMSSMNNRVNILYFIDHLLEQSAKQSYDGFVCKIKHDLPQIIDSVVPDDGTGAQNVGSARKVLLKLKGRNIMDEETYNHLLGVLASRAYLHEANGSAGNSQRDLEQEQERKSSIEEQSADAFGEAATAAPSTGSRSATASQGGYSGAGTTTTIMTTQPDTLGINSGGSGSSDEASPVALVPNPTAPTTLPQDIVQDITAPAPAPAPASDSISPTPAQQQTQQPTPPVSNDSSTAISQPAVLTAPTTNSASSTTAPMTQPSTVPTATATTTPLTTTSSQNPKQIRRKAIEERMEEDRERHKRQRENIWAILPPDNASSALPSTNGVDDHHEILSADGRNATNYGQNYPFPGHLEFDMLWNDPENNDVDSDDMERIEEDLAIKRESLSY